MLKVGGLYVDQGTFRMGYSPFERGMCRASWLDPIHASMCDALETTANPVRNV